jgi:hypothetical protein
MKPTRPLSLVLALILPALAGCPEEPPPDDDDSGAAVDDDDSATDDDDVADDDDAVDDDDSATDDDDDSAGDDDDDVAPPPCQDLNCDGWPDLVFACTEDGSGDYDAHSYVYWGSPAGFDAADRQELPTLGAMGATVADFDQDGWPDIAFNSVSDGQERDRFVDSMVYWGSPEGFSEANRTLLPTIGAADVTHFDVDGDGWLDLVFSNRYDGGNAFHSDSYRVDSYVYLGSAAGFSVDDRIDIPTFGAGRAAPADLNDDGLVDIAFANGTIHSSESWIYWGTAGGFTEDSRTSVPSSAPEGVTAGDIDLDGHDDLVISNFYSLANLDIDSYVYWGDGVGFSEDRRLDLPTHGATGAIIEDLDEDGFPDLVFANSMAGNFLSPNPATDSTIFWGSLQGLGTSNTTGLPTLSASEVAAADLNLDGFVDLVFANHYNADMDPPADSYVYWGSAEGYDPGNRTGLPTLAAAGLAIGWIPEEPAP